MTTMADGIGPKAPERTRRPAGRTGIDRTYQNEHDDPQGERENAHERTRGPPGRTGIDRTPSNEPDDPQGAREWT